MSIHKSPYQKAPKVFALCAKNPKKVQLFFVFKDSKLKSKLCEFFLYGKVWNMLLRLIQPLSRTHIISCTISQFLPYPKKAASSRTCTEKKSTWLAGLFEFWLRVGTQRDRKKYAIFFYTDFRGRKVQKKFQNSAVFRSIPFK